VAICRPKHRLSFSSKIERCVVLVRANPGAARRFYQLAVTHLSPSDVAKFILAIHSAIMQCVQNDGAGEDGVRRRREEVNVSEEEEATPDGHSEGGCGCFSWGDSTCMCTGVCEESNKAEVQMGDKAYLPWFVVPAGLIIIMKVVFLPSRIF